MNPHQQFSVREIAWLPVVTSAGSELVTLDDLFTRAHEVKRFDVRDPIVRAALHRFAVSAGVLVAREAGVTRSNAAAHARDGFITEQVTAAFDRIDDRLWLIHPRTPFMQSKPLQDIRQQADTPKPGVPASSLIPRTPGAAGVTWFDVAGEEFNDLALTPAAAALALVSQWFYAPKSNSRITEDLPAVGADDEPESATWASLGSLGMADLAAHGRSLTFWHRGDTLAEFLMLNTARYWLEETSQPMWAADHQIVVHGDTLAGNTFTGSATHLDWDSATELFPTAVFAGHPTGRDARRVKELTVEQLRMSSLDDPTRVWLEQAVGKETVTKPFTGFSFHSSSAQNLRHWFVEAGKPNIRDGVLLSRTGDIEVLQLEAKAQYGMPTVTFAGWIEFRGGQLEPDDVARNLIAELAETIAGRPERKLKAAFDIAFPKIGSGRDRKNPPQYHDAVERSISELHSRLEPIFGRAVAQIIAGVEPESLIAEVQAASVTAYDNAAAPYLSTRTLPGIARGRGQVTGPRGTDHTEPDASDPVYTLTRTFIRRSRSDTRYRVGVSRGALAVTSHQSPIVGSLADLPAAESIGVTRALGIIATHHRLQHAYGISLGESLARLSRTLHEDVNASGGVSGKLAGLPGLDTEQATEAISGLLKRLAELNIPVCFHDIVRTLRRWDSPNNVERRSHRLDLIYRFHTEQREHVS